MHIAWKIVVLQFDVVRVNRQEQQGLEVYLGVSVLQYTRPLYTVFVQVYHLIRYVQPVYTLDI